MSQILPVCNAQSRQGDGLECEMDTEGSRIILDGVPSSAYRYSDYIIRPSKLQCHRPSTKSGLSLTAQNRVLSHAVCPLKARSWSMLQRVHGGKKK
jgi:hypothetical protein